jgi:hypothetical protein
MGLHILIVELDDGFHLVLYLVNVGEAQLVQAGIDFPGLVLGVELADEGGRNKTYPILIIINKGEIILLDVDGLVGTGLDALSAVHALIVADNGLAVTYADGACRARAHAGGAALAEVAVHSK